MLWDNHPREERGFLPCACSSAFEASPPEALRRTRYRFTFYAKTKSQNSFVSICYILNFMFQTKSKYNTAVQFCSMIVKYCL